MEFKKCVRCGCFFLSNDEVCCNCKPKDLCDSKKLGDFLENAPNITSIEDISIGTGISVKNISRFIESGKYNLNTIDKNVFGNISIHL